MSAEADTTGPAAEPSGAPARIGGAGLGSGATVPAGGGGRLIVPAIDGFRGLAALTVLLYHVTAGAGRPPLHGARSVLLSGYMGVDFFFVISGFVLFLPTVVAGGRFGNVRAYGIRRAARIIPAYYVALVFAISLHPLLSHEATPLPWSSKAGALSFVLHLSFLQHSVGLARGLTEGYIVLAVAWTLTIEATFYVLLPIVASWYYRHPFLGLGIALVCSALWKAVATRAAVSVWFLPGTASTPILRLMLVTQIPTYLAHFGAGMTAAWLFMRWRKLGARRICAAAVAVQVSSALFIVWCMRAAGLRDLAGHSGTYDHWTGTLPVGLAFAVLLLSTALAPRWSQVPVTNPASRRLGDVSYGLYLWHSVVIALALTTFHVSQNGTTGAFLPMLVIALGGSLVAAWASLAWVERPAISWARRRSARLQADEHADHSPAPDASLPASTAAGPPRQPDRP